MSLKKRGPKFVVDPSVGGTHDEVNAELAQLAILRKGEVSLREDRVAFFGSFLVVAVPLGGLGLIFSLLGEITITSTWGQWVYGIFSFLVLVVPVLGLIRNCAVNRKFAELGGAKEYERLNGKYAYRTSHVRNVARGDRPEFKRLSQLAVGKELCSDEYELLWSYAASTDRYLVAQRTQVEASRAAQRERELQAAQERTQAMVKANAREWVKGLIDASGPGGFDAATAIDEAVSLLTDDVAPVSAKVRFAQLREAYETVLLDPLNVLDYPTLFDASVESTAAFLDRFFEVSDSVVLQADLVAVSGLERLWRAAREFAEFKGMTYFADQAGAARARKLVVLAVDESATPAERALAHERAAVALEGLFPERVLVKAHSALSASRARLELVSAGM